MARTHFGQLFNLAFPPNEPDLVDKVFGGVEEWVAFVLSKSEVYDGKVFQYGFYKTDKTTHEEVLTQVDLTRSVWIRGMANGVDMLTQFMSDNTNIHKSLGALGNKTEKVGGEEGGIFELRRMAGTQPYDVWKTLALAAFDSIRKINAAQNDK